MLNMIFYILVFPGFLFCFLMGMLLSGINRKLVARMQRRIGPPIIQPFYDFFKLIGKERIIPKAAAKKAFIIAPIIALVSVVTISLFIPIFSYTFVPNTADIIVILYLITIPAVMIMVGGSSSASPYAGVGISREMVTMLSYELPLVIILLTVGAKAGFGLDCGVTFSLAKIGEYQGVSGIMLSNWTLIPAALAYLLIIPAEIGSVPFDVAEAETEICEGPLVEYSGFYLAMYKLTQGIKMFIMASLFTALFIGGNGLGPITGSYILNIFLNTVIFVLIDIVVIMVSVSFAKAVVARIKVEQTLKFFWTIPTALAVVSLILTYVI